MPTRIDYPKIVVDCSVPARKKICVYQKAKFSKEKLKIPLLFLGGALVLTIIFSCFYFTRQFAEILTFPSFDPNVPLVKEDEIDPEIKEFGIKIDKIDITAPIIANVDGADKTAYMEALKKGVAHFENTSLPGEGSNIFIFGHSSTTSGIGSYAKIFAKLDDLEKDDKITVFYKEEEFIYEVFSKIVVEKTELSVLDPTKKEQLTIMTCWPVGTIDKRLIVKAFPIE